MRSRWAAPAILCGTAFWLACVAAPVLQEEDCPAETSIHLRLSTGTTCDDFAVQIAGQRKHCVDECDELSILRDLARAASGRCSAWCSERRCATATFVPPTRCEAYECSDDGTCESEECPWFEDCYLLQSEDEFNCYCRDLIES